MTCKLIDLRIPAIPHDENSNKYLDELCELTGVETVVAFPDSYTKSKYTSASYKVTIPSSVAIATTRDILYPQFRSRGIGCGMMLISLPISRHEWNEDYEKAFVDAFSRSPFSSLAYRARIPLFGDRYDLSAEELRKITYGGAPALLEKYKFDKKALDGFESGGVHSEVTKMDAAKYLRASWFTHRTVRLRHGFGTYIGGNHFAEIQEVETLHEKALGLVAGQLVIMVHTGCQSLEDIIREDVLHACIRQPNFVGVESGTEAYDAFFVAHAAIQNYVHAYRLATLARVRDSFEKVIGSDAADVRAVVECPHNSVALTDSHILYRHNTVALERGGYALVSGNARHSSYLVRAKENSDHFLSSVDHGIGFLLDQTSSQDVNTSREVAQYRFRQGVGMLKDVKRLPLAVNPVASQYVTHMETSGILKLMATLTPIVNLKHRK